MTKKKKIVLIGSILLAVLLATWIVILHITAYNEKKGEDSHILTMYDIALLDLSTSLGQFEAAQSFDNQLACLQVIEEQLKILSAHMQMSSSFIDENTDLYMANAIEVQGVADLIEGGGMVNGHTVLSFKEDDKISTDEAAVIQQLKEDVEKLRIDMRKSLDEEGVAAYEWLLTPSEVFQKLTVVMQDTEAAILKINTV